MTQQSSDVGEEEFETRNHQQRNLTSSVEQLPQSCFQLHTNTCVMWCSVEYRGLPSYEASCLPHGPSGWLHTCCHFTDDFGIFLVLDVVITLKLQQHHLQVDVVTHLKLPHYPVSLPVQGCCRGNVAKESEMSVMMADSLSIHTDLDVQHEHGYKHKLLLVNTKVLCVNINRILKEVDFLMVKLKLYLHPGLLGYMCPTN